MRAALLTPMRLLAGIVALTILCMFAVALVTDHLADNYLIGDKPAPSSRVHLINEVTQSLKRATDCKTSYLATGDGIYLQEYRAACDDVDTNMERLVTEDRSVSSKLAHAQDLREFVRAKLSEIGNEIRSRPAAAPGSARTATADEELQRIVHLLDQLGEEEKRDVTGEIEAVRARRAFHHQLVIALAVINVLFLGAVAFCASQIGKLYSLVTMCAWSKRVQYEDKWIPLEEYMSKRFGIRISHGISQEEYDKWATPEMAAMQQPSDDEDDVRTGASLPPPKAAA